jgi:endonuclease/exonuclease/phosphatase family metal-dependent hydrolase
MLVGSYNIRYQNKEDNERGNSWKQRCPVICDQVNFLAPDIFGAQEVLHPQLLDLLQGLDGYDYIGVGRDDGKTEGEYAAIFYKKDHIRLLDNGNFWLSETPEKPGLGWDAACIRICTYVHLKDRNTKKKIWFFNLHMDHVGVTARAESAKLIVSKIKELTKSGEKVFVTGDFNVDQTNDNFPTFTSSGVLSDSYEKAEQRYAPNGTVNSFDPNLFSSSRIDHIFVSPSLRVCNYGVFTETYRAPIELGSSQGEKRFDFPDEISFQKNIAKTLSDHFPVIIKVYL